jgi:hypothetical protein
MLLRTNWFSSLSVLVIIAGGLACPGRASADFTVYVGGVSAGSPTSTGQLIDFNYKQGNNTYTFNDQYAGQLLASFVSPGRVGDFTIYCVDIDHSISVPTSWNVSVNGTGTIYGATVNNAGQIAYLMDHYGNRQLDADHSAGLQAAIWKMEYGNNFTMTKASQGVSDAYNTYLGYVTGANSGNVATAGWLNPTGLDSWGQAPQGQVTATATPAPSSFVLGAGALVCFGAFFCLRRLCRARGEAVLAQ